MCCGRRVVARAADELIRARHGGGMRARWRSSALYAIPHCGTRSAGFDLCGSDGLLRSPPAQPANQQEVEPMGNAYEIYALRYATMSPRTPHLNYLVPDPHETTAQDLDYFVWLIRGSGRDILVDTGFNAAEARLRNRKLDAQSGRGAGALRRRGRGDQGRCRHPSALRPRRQSRPVSRRRGFICRTAR